MNSIIEQHDILHVIYEYLDFATISAISTVCKTFSIFSKEYYKKKLNNGILNPAKLLYNSFFEKHLRFYLSRDQYTLLFSTQRTNFVQMLFEFELFIIPFIQQNFWLLFLYDLQLMEQAFVFLSRIDNIMEKNKYKLFFDTQLPDYSERIALYCRLQNVFDILDNYMYVEYPGLYYNDQLHMMAKFKKIFKQSSMNKLELTKALQRPVDEVYYLQ